MISFYTKNAQKNQVIIIGKVRYKGTSFNFSTGIKCDKKVFKNQMFHYSAVGAKRWNAQLDGLRSRFKELVERDTPPDQIKALLFSKEKSIGFFDGFDNYIKTRDCTKRHIQRLEFVKNKIYEIDPGIQYKDIDMVFYQLLREKLNVSQNTFSGYVKQLKSYMNYAYLEEWHNERKYKKLPTPTSYDKKQYFTEDEIQKIYSLQGLSREKEAARDWFVLACKTGLRFSDWHQLRPENIQKVDSGYDLHVKTSKTGEVVVIPLSKISHAIILKRPRLISNQKINDHLKVIPKMAGVQKEARTHDCRRSFCTNLFLKGVPALQIMKISGHRTITEFIKYVGADKVQNADLVRKFL